jgi:hypothetical protein
VDSKLLFSALQLSGLVLYVDPPKDVSAPSPRVALRAKAAGTLLDIWAPTPACPVDAALVCLAAAAVSSVREAVSAVRTGRAGSHVDACAAVDGLSSLVSVSLDPAPVHSEEGIALDSRVSTGRLQLALLDLGVIPPLLELLGRPSAEADSSTNPTRAALQSAVFRAVQCLCARNPNAADVVGSYVDELFAYASHLHRDSGAVAALTTVVRFSQALRSSASPPRTAAILALSRRRPELAYALLDLLGVCMVSFPGCVRSVHSCCYT